MNEDNELFKLGCVFQCWWEVVIERSAKTDG